MKHKKLIIVGLVILLLIDLGLIYQKYKSGQTPKYEVVAAKTGDIASVISSTGAAEPASQINLQFTVSGRVIDIKVQVGDQVKAGQVLVSQDASDLIFQAQGADANLQAAQAKLNQILAGASPEDIALAQTAVDNAKTSLADAKTALADAQKATENELTSDYQSAQRTLQTAILTEQIALRTNGETLDNSELNVNSTASNFQALIDSARLRSGAEQDYNSTKTAVDNAVFLYNQANIETALDKLQNSLSLTVNALTRTYDVINSISVSSTLTQTKLDTYKTNVTGARTSANTALTNVTSGKQTIESQKITNQTNLNLAQAKVAVAQGVLASAEDQLTQKLAKPRDVDIDVYRAQVKQAQATLNQIRNQIAQKTLTAPIDGIITSLPLEKGEIASPTQVAVAMNSLVNFEIKSDIAESDIANIKVGDPVQITFDAFGETEKWQGTVTKIDPAQTVVQGVVYYKTTISLTQNDSRIKAGMTANLEIETARHQNVLIIPTRAIKDNGSQKSVSVLNSDGQTSDKVVGIGIKSDSGEAEVISGLSAGDKIVIN